MIKYENGVYTEMTRAEEEQLKAAAEDFNGMQYPELVNLFVREKYSAADEFALLRQKEEKPEEFMQYFAYCERCKERARARV